MLVFAGSTLAWRKRRMPCGTDSEGCERREMWVVFLLRFSDHCRSVCHACPGWPGTVKPFWPGCNLIIITVIIMYIYHVLINALSAHMIHINLNKKILYTRREQSYQNNLHKVLYMETRTRIHTHTHFHCNSATASVVTVLQLPCPWQMAVVVMNKTRLPSTFSVDCRKFWTRGKTDFWNQSRQTWSCATSSSNSSLVSSRSQNRTMNVIVCNLFFTGSRSKPE